MPLSVNRRGLLLGALASSVLCACGGGQSWPEIAVQAGPSAAMPRASAFMVRPFAHRVEVTAADGHTSSVGGLGTELGQFNFPVGVAVSKRFAFVVELGNHRVQVLDASGRSVGTFGEGVLDHPGAISVHDDQIWVADSRHSRLVQFDSAGRAQGVLGAGILAAPRGMSWNGDALTVADPGTGHVHVFDAAGQARTLGPRFALPWDTAQDEQFVYVADAATRQITVLTRGGLVQEHIAIPASPLNLSWSQARLGVTSAGRLAPIRST